ncbi:MAG: PrsW family intramembrane metalloprotease [Bradyrhizobium sp.]|uniref:PrsW family glutamic-type intramembrane protease n=1 Tax=Bradyrhizobium sp. TaxID=376 RepID=UPI001C28DD1D|nr:PrsW family glutamic-type intramembrane protease [Bradyrhizobium sp.]MBU6464690.1 PrsW family intramembrane metalloprotease [Pseudomonadota bacterium]MDE2068383.1 PrsW family intramembrane metalloprotease [Bradyrhizobium sp.]MDE2243171.1 PrsW family intramembrane metalloprotease [Bradyrhizobium sp.]MDE2472464.1 PrsW family intramembrane metalloprotease [Bradyrhizobium sp.]
MNLLASLPTVIGTAAVAPALLILWLVIAADERPGPAPRIWTAFLLGAASISLLGVIRAPFLRLLATPENPWIVQAMHSLFGVALPEEAVKILVILAVSARRRPFADPMDTVVYGAAAGLGFAAYENLAYLVQHAEMWRALAALRSVLTVPFHGALGVIAGAYLAIARSGTALGAHRHNRDWARISSWMLVLLAPLGLHAAFDYPLLTLQRAPDIDSTTRLILGSASVLTGFSSIAFAIRLVRRVGRHHAPRTDLARQRLGQLRRMWALLVVGGGAGFIGLVFVLTSIHHWLVNPDRNVSLVLIPIGLVSILIGIALLVVTTAIYILGRNRMRGTARGFSSAPSQG